MKKLTTYVAMLRGINVSGKNLIKMESLRQLFETLGFSDIQTYVQSGNVVFKAAHDDETRLSETISRQIEADFSFKVPVMIRTGNEIHSIIKANPFLKDSSVDVSKLHVTFLSTRPSKVGLEKLDALPLTNDKFHVQGREIYLYCPDGYGTTKLSNNAFEKCLSVSATSRNWKTVCALFDLI
jgi:uncharacterized protein (DUF1697 family)